uniref:Uncharacterized protein n=1 Tax=Ascaris lumbricoides TaxID=6252 RepID=A0A0M3HX60_ASCLU
MLVTSRLCACRMRLLLTLSHNDQLALPQTSVHLFVSLITYHVDF